MSGAKLTDDAAVESDVPANDAVPAEAIVFFDGVCGMCNRSVDFMIKRDRKRYFRFSPLQGETAGNQLDSNDIDSLGSIVLRNGEKTYRHSTAIVRILWHVGGIWSFWAALLWLIPWPLRDLAYKIIGANRYRFFGKKEACRLPTPDERARFLP